MNLPTTDPPRERRIGSLFSGSGMLEMATQSVLGGSTAWVSEIDPGACRILAHRLPDVPNLGDVAAVDWANVEPVDILTGGFPCQDVSHAGARAGMGPGTRSGLWSRMADAIDHLRPSLVIAENVRGLLSAEAASDVEPCPWCLGDGAGEPVLRALGCVLGDLSDIGYDASWYGLRAADVGAPHARFRVFVLAWPAGSAPDAGGLGWFRGARLVGGGGAAAVRVEAGGHVGDEGGARTSADADGIGSVRAGGARDWRDGSADDGGHAPADADRGGCEVGQERNLGPQGRLAAPFGGDADGRVLPASLEGDLPPADTDGWGLRGDGLRDDLGGTDTGGWAAPTEGRGGDAWGPYEPASLEGDPAPPDAERATGGASTGLGDGPEASPGTGPTGVPSGRGPLRDVDWGPYEPAIRRWERRLGRPAPAPTEPGSKGQPRLSPRFVEFMMGLPAGWVTDVPGLSRNDQLKALGNGVVPAQAAAAVRFMLARLAEESRRAA